MHDSVMRETVLRRGLCIVVLAFVPALARADEPPSRNVIEFKTWVRGSKGSVRCGLFTRAGWLKKAVRAAATKVNGATALCVFQRVPEGIYGISAFHDENDNGKIDTNFLGMPTEDYCASRN